MEIIRFTPASLLARFVGRTFRDMITELSEQFQLQISEQELEDLVFLEKQKVMEALSNDLQAAEGAQDALDLASQRYTIAVVSSSAKDRLELCLRKADQLRFFSTDCVFSAATCLEIPRGKPAPDIYLLAMSKLLKSAAECVAIEDSPIGVRSARSAGIEQVIGYLGCYQAYEREEKSKILREAGASLLMNEWSEFKRLVDDRLPPGSNTFLFDYDNTLALTEHVAFAACCQVVNATLEKKSKKRNRAGR